MPAKEQLNDLAERRRLLLLEADLHRNVIRLECENIRKRVSALASIGERMKAGSPWVMAGSAVASIFALRHWRKVVKWTPAALGALRWIKSLKRRRS